MVAPAHRRPPRAAPPRRRRAGACARRGARASPRSRRAARSPTPPTTRCVLEPEGTFVGTVNEDFAIEANGGDIFQLGNTSWRILRVEPGIVRVADAKGQPPTHPVLAGRGARRARASCPPTLADLREECAAAGTRTAAALRSATRRAALRRGGGACRSPSTSHAGRRALGRGAHAAARRARALLRRERRHAARGARAVRRRASTAPGASRCASASARLRLRAAGGGQRGGDRALARAAAQLPAGGGLRLPASRRRARDVLDPGAARRADVRDALALERAALAAARARRATASGCRRRSCACAPTTCWPRAFPAGARLPRDAARRADSPVPMEHPIVRQTIEDCLTEAMDVGRLPRGAARAARRARSSARAVDTPEPSAFARGILSTPALHLPRRRAARGAPHAGGDDAPHPRRRARPTSSARSTPTPSRACARRPGRSRQSAEEVHEALLWMGYVDGRGGRALAAVARRARRGRPRRPRGRPLVRGRGDARPEGGAARPARGARAGVRRAGSDDEALLLQLESRGRRAARAHRRAHGLVRPPAARAHPPLHARPPAPRDRAGHAPPSSCASSPAGSTSIPSTASTARAASPRSCEQLAGFEVPAAAWEAQRPAARACAATSASGSTS